MQNWFYTKGGERQGPVSLAELEAMACRGKIDPQKDLVWTEGMQEWKLGAEVDGLFKVNSAHASDDFNPYAAPLTAADNLLASFPTGSIAEIPYGSVNMDVMAVVKRASTLTRRHFGTLIAIGLVYLVIVFGVELLIALTEEALGLRTTGLLPGGIGAEAPGAASQHSLFGFLISSVFSVFFGLGLSRSFLNIASGEVATVATLFSQGPKLINALLASFLYGLIVGLGLLLLIVPGIILALRFSMFQEAILDRNLGAIESLKYSAELTQNNRINIFVLGLLGLFIIIAGILALVVGLIYAAPVVMLATPLAYRYLQYGSQALADHPGTEIPVLQGNCPKN